MTPTAAEDYGSCPTLVDWDGPDDSQNPMNWSNSKKCANLIILSLLTILTPLGSSMFAPGIPAILDEFNEHSAVLSTFIMSVYIIGFAFGPFLVAPLSELFGRRPLYISGNILFVIFAVATGFSQNLTMMVVFRLFMGFAGCVPVTLGGGSIADMIPATQRGRAMSAWSLGPLLGPCIGPIAGGYLIQAASWRWVFWFISILGAIFIPINFLYLEESFAPVLLEQKTKQLRISTGNPNLRSHMALDSSIQQQFKRAISRPLRLLFFTPIISLLAFHVAVTYGTLNLLVTTFSFVYPEQYGFEEGQSGLTYLPAGIGMVIGVVIFGQLTDLAVKRHKARGLEHKPEVRLLPFITIPSGLALPTGLFIYGWTAEKHIHWIVPMIGVMIFTIGMMGLTVSIQGYVIDTYSRHAASASAALTALKSLLGALLPLGGLQMYRSLGLGWGNSLLAFVALALAPMPVALYYLGEGIRKRGKPHRRI